MADYGHEFGNKRVREWECGLPSEDDLTPLSQVLFTRQLAIAFKINPEPRCTKLDVDRASMETLSSLRRGKKPAEPSSFTPYDEFRRKSELQKKAKIGAAEEGENSSFGDEQSGRSTLRRSRLVWKPQLHKRFVDVVTHLGIKRAVPKTIMELMNVEGLTRENVSSHLQKYRMYLKRMQGPNSGGGSSDSDELLASNLNYHGHLAAPDGFLWKL